MNTQKSRISCSVHSFSSKLIHALELKQRLRATGEQSMSTLKSFLKSILIFTAFCLVKTVCAQQVDDFYVPLPETSALTFFDNINTDAATPLITRTDIVVRENGTEIIYDPFVDGYESQYINDNLWAVTTERWGDNNCGNGFNPNNVVCDAGTPDTLAIGEVLVFDQTEAFSQDYFRSNRTINLTRSLWPSVANTLLAGAFELFPTSQWGTDYVLPIGEGTTRISGSGSMFEQVAVTVMAGTNNTNVLFDPDGPGGVAAISAVLNRGQSIEFGLGAGANGQALNVLTGATITTDAPVQANVMTGDNGSNYEARFYTLFPNSLLSNVYYEAVGSSDTGNPSAVFLYNPDPNNAITIEIYNNTDPTDATPTTVSVPANSAIKQVVPGSTGQGLTGLRLESSGGEIFSAYTVIDDNGQAHDWGHVTTPERLMGDTIRVGFAPGRDPESTSTQNASPVWVIADLPGTGTAQNIEICVDAAGDGGPLNDPATGRNYDYSFVTQPLDSTRIYDNGVAGNSTNNNGGNQTGILAFACDPGIPGNTATPSDVLIAAAWGQDPQRASAASPGFDVGTTIRTGSNNRLFVGDLIFEDLDGDGIQDIGEPGLANVSVTISTTNPAIDVNPDTAGVQNTRTLQTDSNGTYLFSNLTSGETYTIAVVPPIGFLQVSDPDGTLDNTTILTLTSSTLDQDFGYSQAVIGDFIYLDNDLSGTPTAGDTGIPGVEVEICRDVITVSATDLFNAVSYNNNPAQWEGPWVETGDNNSPASGAIFIPGSTLRFDDFSGAGRDTLDRMVDFTGVTGPGSAQIEIPWSSSTGNYEANDTVEIQISTDGVNFTTIFQFIGDPAGGGAATIADIEAEVSGVETIAFDPLGSSALTIRFSADEFNGGNEALDFDSVTVSSVGVGGEVCQTTNTDVNGFYVFPGLIDAVYTVTVDPNNNTLPTGLIQTGDPDATLDNISTVGVIGGVGSLDEDFGYVGTSISGKVLDAEGNSLSAVVIELYSDPNGDGDLSDGVLVATTTTDANGDYIFNNVSVGSYIVSEIDPAGFQAFSDTDSTPDGDAANVSTIDNLIPVTVTAGEQDDGNDFVDAQFGSITGQVWLDEDQDGFNDIEEGGITAVVVELQDGTCIPGNNCPTVVTDQFGNYKFSGLLPGNYSVNVVDATLPSGVAITAGPFGVDPRPVTLGAGDNVADQDFGYITNSGTGIIGDRVWSDGNGNGIQDLGETGITGVTLALISDAGADGIFGTPDDGAAVATTTTTGDGDYLFTGVPLGDYAVVITDSGSVLTGFTATAGPQSEGGVVSSPITIDAAVPVVTDVDFGFNSGDTLSITDRVWYDSDGNQSQDAGEPGIAGVTVDLVNAAGDIIATTSTDGSGDFTFTGISEGLSYVLQISDRGNALNGLSETTGTNNNAVISGSLGTAANVVTANDVLNTLGDDDTPTFGYNNPGSIAGTLFSDADNNAALNADEAGLGGILVSLTPAPGVNLGNGPGVAITTRTEADGSYLFDGLPPGDYQLDVPSPPVGVNTVDPDSAPGDNTAIGINLAVGEGLVDQNFGYFDATANAINGTVFLDIDKDGLEEEDGADGINGTADDEIGFAGVTLELVDNNVITQDIRNGLVDINDDGVVDANDDGTVAGITVINGSFDIDGNGIINEADNGQAGPFNVVEGMVTVSIGGTATQSSDFNAQLTAENAIDGNPLGDGGGTGGNPYAHTDLATPTEFFDLDLGYIENIDSLKIFNRDDCCDGRLGNVFVFVADTPFPSDVNDLAGAQANADFSFQLPINTVGVDPVVLVNASGRYIRLQKSGNNVGVPNTNALHFAELKVLPTLIEGADNKIIATTVTDANGDYSFPGLSDGDYQVRVTDDAGLLAGYDLTSGLDTLEATVAGADVNDVDFGYINEEATGSISGEVFLDENANGTAESTEANYGGVDVFLCLAADAPCNAGNAITTAITDASGEYVFNGLTAGNYAVDIDTADVPAGLNNTVDPAPVALSEGESVDEVDFGFVPAAGNGLISGTTWIDADANGVFDTGESPLAGVTINVFDPNSVTPGTPIATVLTGADGSYEVPLAGVTLVDDLVVDYVSPGTPGIDFTQPTNLPAGVTNYSADDVDVASDADRFIGDLNFGFPPSTPGGLGSITGTIYSDSDQDGDYASAIDGEFEGVTLNLLDSGGNVIATSTSDANGNYSFTGLLDDSYNVVVTDINSVLQDVNVNEVFSSPIAISGGNDVTDVDQGYISETTDTLGSIGSLIFIDTNENGFFDDGEPRVPGVTVQCWVDNPPLAAANDPSIATPAPTPGVDNLVRTVTTDTNGEYYCTNLPAGQYTVVVSDVNGILTGYTDTSPNNTANSPADNFAKPFTYAATTTAGNPNLAADFGVVAPASISGTVYFDDDANGGFEPPAGGTDSPLGGIAVEACDANNVCITVFTENDGTYTIPVGPGSWTVTVLTPPNGTTGLEVPSNPIAVTAGDDIADIDFGFIDAGSEKVGTITGNVSEDTTGDGAGDTPLPGAVVQLYTDPNGDGDPSDGVLVDTQNTNGSGDYAFNNLNLNSGGASFVVLEIDPAGYASVSDTQSVETGLATDLAANTNSNDNLIPVTLTQNETDANNNFVDVRPASIAGTVWLDEDGDGINDIEEAGLTGIVVELLDGGGNVVATTSTDQFGNYVFDGVPPGDYTVNVDDTSLPPSLQATAGPGGIDPKPVTVAPGDTVEDIDFGYLPVPNTGAIGDRVWSDANSNGIQDPGEVGIEGVTLTLLDSAGTPVGATVTSGPDGDYLFTNVPFGDDYTVSIAPADAELVGYTPTSGPQSEGGFVSNPVTLSPALTTVTDLDFGFNLANSNTISDTVWFDENGDGVFDPTEAPIAGVTVNLYEDLTGPGGVGGPDGLPDDNDNDGQPDVIATATTDENGDVSFTGLDDGTYIVEVTDTSSELQGLNGTTPEAVSTLSDPVAVAGGASSDVESFGYNNPGLIEGTVFSDANGVNGQEPGETGLGGITVTLREDTTGNGVFDTVVATVQTNPDGTYGFDGLPPGDYQVTVTPPAGTQTEDPDVALDDVTEITLGIGESSVDNDFGYQNPALADISGTVFLDTDKDGVEETNGNDGAPGNADDEPGFAGITVDLIDCGAGTCNDGDEETIGSTTTDANGDYSFPDRPDGNYQVAVTDESGLLSGYDITSGLDELPVTLDGTNVADVDFGYIKDEATGSISGEVFVDETAINGVADDEETNLSGITVFLCNAADAPCNSGNAIATTVTDVAGEYVFNDLPAGQYVVDADPTTIPADLDLTVDPAAVALSEGENVTDVDIGYEPAANTGVLSGFVWTDVIENGVYDSTEAPIGGVDIFVYSTTGTPPTSEADALFTTTTKPDGSWIITGISGADLQDGYIVTYDDDDIPAVLNSAQPTNLPPTNDLYSPVDLASDPDNNISFLDFAFAPNNVGDLSSISGTIYSDANQDDDYVPGDDGELEGVTLNLLDSVGNVIATTQTNANGGYLFEGLVAGDYQVVVTDRNNVLQDLNPNDDVLNGGPGNNPVPITITVPANTDVTNQDAGYVSDEALGSIGNRFWFDTNGDGIVDDDEPGVEGVTIQLWLDNNQNAVADDPSVASNVATQQPEPGIDNLVRTVTTDENGEYYFTSLPAGQYIVVVTDANGFDETTDTTVIPGGAGDGLAKPWTYALTKSDGTPNFTADFGVTGSNSIAGKIFIEDEDLVEPAGTAPVAGSELDGVTSPTVGGANPGDVSADAPAEGVTVVLFIEQADGTFDEIQRTTTDANGDYSFVGLPDGNYRVDVLPSGSPIDGFGQTGDPDLAPAATNASDLVCDSATAALCDDSTTLSLSGENVTAVDFGYQKNFTTTPVTINAFNATGGSGTVEFSWETSNEVGHIGYQLYARTADAWVLLNDQMISSNDLDDALQTRGYTYTAYNVEASWFALVDVSVNEELTIHGPYKLGESYGEAVEETPEFDWDGIDLLEPSKAETQRSVNSRVQRLLLNDDGVDDADDAQELDDEELEDEAFDSAVNQGGL